MFSLPTVVCRFSPVRYVRDSRGKSMVGSVSDVIGCEYGLTRLVITRYAHVLAVTTTEEVFLYRSDELGPRFYVGNIHYAQICDFAWCERGRGVRRRSADGKFALTASSDGYCTLFQFEKGDLGAVRS